MTIRQRWDKTSLHNKALVVIGAFAAFGTVFYAGAAAVQVYIMKAASEDSTRQVTALSGKAKEIIESIRTTESQMEKSLADALAQNKAALDASIEASRNDQRAWIGVKEIVLTRNLAIGQPVVIAVTALNTGRSPAIKLSLGQVSVGPEENSSSSRNLTIADTYRGVIAPNNNDVFFASMTYSDESIRALIGGTIRIYIRGRFEYQDVFHRPHKTEFCGYYPTGGATLNFYNCTSGNFMD